MKNLQLKAGLLLLAATFFSHITFAQLIHLEEDGNKLQVQKMVATTSVKDQGRTGTCWSFSTTSFIESEALRQGKGEHDVSEMYFVRHNYPAKAKHYVRMQGYANFGQGSLSHDVTTIVKNHGILPEEIYDGKKGEEEYDHTELIGVLKGFLEGVVEGRSAKPTEHWTTAFDRVLDTYLGEVPEAFDYKDKKYSPEDFADEVLGFDPSNYIEITSYEHQPFYEKLVLEVPDNWASASYYNLPIDELEAVMDNAIDKGYSIAWDGDVSEKSFSHKKGMAIIPETDWEEMSKSDKKHIFDEVIKEKEITQDMRQETYEDYSTTDDHLMHIVGLIVDGNGTKYYVTKNSWGADSNDFGGYLYMSKAYNRLKCVAIMVHKDAVPESLKKKLNI